MFLHNTIACKNVESFLCNRYNNCMKKGVVHFLITTLLFAQLSCYAEDVFQGHAVKDEQQQEQSELFTGKIETLDKHDVIKMTVSQVIDGSYSFEGDEFFAKVTNDVMGDKGVVIPKGTIAHGIISQSSEAKRLGRDGYISLKFDYLITPDGRQIPIEGNVSTKMHPLKAAGKIVATDLGYTAAGGVIGGYTALSALGIEAAILSNGYTVAGGAALGGTVGLAMSLYRKGKDVLIAPGDEIRVKVSSSVSLPVYKESALKQEELDFPGLTVRIANILYEKDPFGELNTITLSMSISNMSTTVFSGMDVTLVNDLGQVFNPSVFGDTRLMFSQIKPGDRLAGKISFSVNNVNDSYWLTFYDRLTKKPVAKISLDNAYKNVSDKVKKKNNKIKKRNTNYYKDKSPFDM